MQRSLAIKQPVRNRQGSKKLGTKRIGEGAGLSRWKFLQGPWWRLQEEGGATAKGIWGDSAG